MIVEGTVNPHEEAAMEDEKIIEMYFARDEAAIYETRAKYGPYCTAIAYNILSSFEDTEECVSDTYLHTWNSIPPNRPENLKGYVGRITHNLALTIFRKRNAKKRCAVQMCWMSSRFRLWTILGKQWSGRNWRRQFRSIC